MKTVHKYMLNSPGAVEQIEMPSGAKILHVGEQNGHVCIWAEVETKSAPAVRRFIVYGTGHEINSKQKISYLGTVVLFGGTLVLHVYEVQS